MSLTYTVNKEICLWLWLCLCFMYHQFNIHTYSAVLWFIHLIYSKVLDESSCSYYTSQCNLSRYISMNHCCPQINIIHSDNSQSNTVPVFYSGYRQACLSHPFDRHLKYISSYLSVRPLQHVGRKRLSDISETPVAHRLITVPRRSCKVPQLDNLCWFDPIFLQAVGPPSKKPCQWKLSAHSMSLQLFASIHSSKQHWGFTVWSKALNPSERKWEKPGTNRHVEWSTGIRRSRVWF